MALLRKKTKKNNTKILQRRNKICNDRKRCGGRRMETLESSYLFKVYSN